MEKTESTNNYKLAFLQQKVWHISYCHALQLPVIFHKDNKQKMIFKLAPIAKTKTHFKHTFAAIKYGR